MANGSLNILIKKFRSLPLELVKNFSAQLIQALTSLHARDLIYRDLKPENILLTNEYASIRLGDFGLTKALAEKDRTYTMCGTPEYMAPEIIVGQGYGRSVDFWALGMVIYELINGETAFRGTGPNDVCKKVTTERIQFPLSMNKAAKSLVKHLCDYDVERRNSFDIKEHKFFRDF